jgi:transposase
VIGTPQRFHCGKQIASYVGLVPTEESSGDRRRLGHISKQGKLGRHLAEMEKDFEEELQSQEQQR